MNSRLVTVGAVEKIRKMCGTITCAHCGNVQDAQAWHHERNEYPLKDYAFRCCACGNPFPSPEHENH